ncbi:MAG: VWA domain-containing protein [Planctomycetes bacterium]|nr:VWA domain-containing protein [Planctomycetota bacterium]
MRRLEFQSLGYAPLAGNDTSFGYDVPLATTQPDNRPQSKEKKGGKRGRPGSGGAGDEYTGPIFGSRTGVSDELLALRGQLLTSLARTRSSKGKGSPRGGRGGEPLYDLGYAGWDGDDAVFSFRYGDGGNESYDQIVENPFRLVAQNPLSTFSIDVDTASYSNVRRMLNNSQWPPAGAVRIEEMVNYFDYDYPQPEGDDPFGVDIEVASCPWREEHRLVRVGLKGYELEANERPMANLVFLLDVSGSMNNAYKLPLVKESMRMLVENLSGDDYVAIVVYAGAAGEVLPSTSAANQGEILGALDDLQAGGSTNAGDGIQLAYQIADDNFIEGGINRVILATDGDFNVGITDRGALDRLITEEAKKGVFLTVLGFGMGNLKDSTMESLADKGNGNYAYIDSTNEAHKVLVEQLSGTLVTIAKDVKIQIEFNPAQVAAYRLIGYENRMLAARDFNDDRKDAGEIGAGHTVTALYEVVPVGVELDAPSIDPLKYQPVVEGDNETAAEDGDYDSDEETEDDGAVATDDYDDGEAATDDYDEEEPDDAADFVPAEFRHELLTLKLRYKQPDGDTSTLMEFPVIDDGGRYVDAGEDFQFAAAVASFGMLLRDSSYKGDATFDSVYEMAESGLGEDYYGYRTEFLKLIDKAAELAPSE